MALEQHLTLLGTTKEIQMKTREELVKAIEDAEVAYDATWEVMIYAEDAADIAKTAAVTAARAADLARKALQAYDKEK